MFPEEIAGFKLFAPDPDGTGWGIADGGGWLPVILADRDACLIVMAMVLGGVDIGELDKLHDRYNCATPSVNVTVEHLKQYLTESVQQ